MVIRTNTMAMNANRSLGVNNSAVGKSLEKLSSGFRINRAADDASGLAISEKMKSQIKGLEQASLNSQDGISLIQTAEGATTEIHNMLNRMKELAVKSANGTIQDEVDREAIQAEVDSLNEEITRISKSTTFNGIQLLDGSLSATGTGSVTGNPTSVNLQTDLDGAELVIEDEAATKGEFETSAFGDATQLGHLTNDSKMSVTATLNDGTTVTIDIFRKDNADRTVGGNYVDADGNVLDTYSTAAPAQGDLTDALVAAFKDSAIADNFKVSGDDTTGIITFKNIEAGASAPQMLKDINVTIKAADGSLTNEATNAVTATPGEDAYQWVDAGQLLTQYDGNSDTVFTIDGQKFGIISGGTAEADYDTLVQKAAEQGVELIVLAEGTTAAGALEFDVDMGGTATAGGTLQANQLAHILSERLGYDVEYVAQSADAATADAAGNASANAYFAFKVDQSVDAADGVGNALTLQVGDTADDFNKVSVSVDDLSAKGINTDGVDLSNLEGAADSLDLIEAAINQVSTNRANLGAIQNRLEYTINNLDTTAENMTAANSRIRDTDMAKEMMNYTKMNILTQAAQSMLAQANQQPQAILQLLQ